MAEVVHKPWGHELIWARTDRYVGKILHIKAGEALSLQYHRIKDETIMLLSGRMTFQYFVDGEPPKTRELRSTRPMGRRIHARLTATVQLANLADLKFVARARRHAKLHLFRMWKLFGEVKAAPTETVYRPVAERIREARSMMRL